MSPDAPFADQRAEDPQSWNMYAYVRSNPLSFVDPTGAALRLPDDEVRRNKLLAAIRDGVGEVGAAYLYPDKVETTNADGTISTAYYLGILGGGPSGRGPAFEKINETTAALSAIVRDSQIVSLRLVGAAEQAPGLERWGGSLWAYGAVGATSPPSSRPPIWSYVQDPSTAEYPKMPGWNMTGGKDAPMGIVDTVFHELGHAWWLMDLRAGRTPKDTSNQRSVQMENQIRKRLQRKYGERKDH